VNRNIIIPATTRRRSASRRQTAWMPTCTRRETTALVPALIAASPLPASTSRTSGLPWVVDAAHRPGCPFGYAHVIANLCAASG